MQDNLRRNLLYVSQVIDLKIPVVVALTMVDLAKKRGIKIDIDCFGKGNAGTGCFG